MFPILLWFGLVWFGLDLPGFAWVSLFGFSFAWLASARLTHVEQNDGLHTEELLTGDLKVGKLLGDELHGQTQVVDGRLPHLVPEEREPLTHFHA